ncbi:MAG: serine hydrolase [Phycisphaerales bacterium]|nr:serine hydrolase [Phycisphaerales bacterium]
MTQTTRRRLLLVLAALCLLGVVAWRWVVAPRLDEIRIALGYASVIAASQAFITGDDLATIRAERLPPAADFVTIELDASEGTATARAFGVFSRTARVRAGLGATRVADERVALPDELPDLVPTPPADRPWPEGSSPDLAPLAPGVDAAALARAIDAAFVDPDTGASLRTHAVLVVHDGRLVAERYRDGYDRFTPLLGWSMTKSITATLVGRLVQMGRLDVSAPAPVPAWSAPDDPRRAITLDDLLRMQSGLHFFTNYTRPDSDSLRMLFMSADAGAYAAEQTLEVAPGVRWSYSDGTSNIVAGIVCRASGSTLRERCLAPQRLLFGPLGMDTAVIGVDGSGTFVGSSLMYASARDWARVGQLYLDDGIWNDERLLPEGWVAYVTAPTAGVPRGRYGAHFWRFDATLDPDLAPELAGVYHMSGYDGQEVFIVPSRRLVVVRLGLESPDAPFDARAFAASVISGFPTAGVRRD